MGFALTFVLIMSICLGGCQEYTQWKNSVEMCKHIKVGTTEKELRFLLQGISVSVKVSADKEKDYWYLSEYELAAEAPRCVVDRSTKRVIQIVCDDDYKRH